MSTFNTWFKKSFGCPVPREFDEFIGEHPQGLSGDAGTLWDPEEIMACTEERDLAEKGVCMIGTTSTLGVFLLRAKDGRVFVVDRTDFGVVDAWFACISTCIGLLDFS